MQAEEHQHLHIAPEDIRAAVVVEVDERQPGEAEDSAFLGVVAGVASGLACSYELESDRPRVQNRCGHVMW